MFGDDWDDDLFGEDIFNDGEYPDEAEDILEELEEMPIEGETEPLPSEEQVPDDELLSMGQVFFIGSIAGQAYSEKIEQHSLPREKKRKKKDL